MEESAGLVENRRVAKRYDCLGQVRIFGENLPGDARGQIFDLSLGGCMLQVAGDLVLKAESPVEMTIHSRGTSFRVRGLVKRRGEGMNPVGVAFEAMTDRVAGDLRYLIGELDEKAKGLRGNPALAPGRVNRRKKTGTAHQGQERRSTDHPYTD